MKQCVSIVFSVDKAVEKIVDKINRKYSDVEVSPYLQRPLRSLVDVLTDRQPTASLAVEPQPKSDSDPATKLTPSASSQG